MPSSADHMERLQGLREGLSIANLTSRASFFADCAETIDRIATRTSASEQAWSNYGLV